MFTLVTVIPGETEAAAKAKLADYRAHIDHEGALALLSGWTGIDFSRYALDEPLRYVKNDAMNSAIEALTVADPGKVWTVREIAEHVGIGGRGPLLVGSPAQIADELEAWMEETDVDGFNLAYAVTPESFADFVDLVVPETAAPRDLQARLPRRHAAREAARQRPFAPGRRPPRHRPPLSRARRRCRVRRAPQLRSPS